METRDPGTHQSSKVHKVSGEKLKKGRETLNLLRVATRYAYY